MTALPLTHAEPKARANPRGPLIALSLAMVLASLGTSIVNVALATLSEAFAATFQAVQWVVLAYLLVVTVAIVIAGKLGDAFGRNRLLKWGVALFTAGSALCAISADLPMLIGARALQGLGGAAMMALTMAAAGQAAPKERVGAAMGLLGAMSALGTALGPSLGGVLLTLFGWRALFITCAALGALTLAIAARVLPTDAAPASKRMPFDIPGAALLALTLGLYALSMTLGHFGTLNIALLLAAVATLSAFVFAETRAPSPIVRLALLRQSWLSAALFATAAVAAVMMTTLIAGPFYLARDLGLSAFAVGVTMSVGPIVAAFAGAPAGRLVDRHGAARMAHAGLAGVAIGCVLMAGAPAWRHVGVYLAASIVLTASYALSQAAMTTLVMQRGAAEERGLLSGLLSLSRNLGLVTGASAMAALFAWGGMTSAFLAGATAVGAAALLRAVRR